jgi:hypothetical protein
LSLYPRNLKVVSSNLTPATKLKPANSKSWRAFSRANSPMPALNGLIQKMLVNTRLSNQVSSCVGRSMSHARHMESDVLFTKRSCIERRLHRVPIRCVARSERPSRRAIRRTAAPPNPPIPTRAAPAETFERSVCVEHFDTSARHWVNVEQRLLMPPIAGHRHAATSVGAASAKPRR